MTAFAEIKGTRYEFDCKGYLVDFSKWNAQVRDWLATREKVSLNGDHDQVIAFLRSYFEENNVHPVVRMITTDMAEKLGQEKGTIKYFHTLFPAGIHQAFMIAGLPMKESCC